VDFFSRKTSFDFMRWRRGALAFSTALTIVSLLFLAFRGLNLSVDFTGGTVIEVAYPQAVDLGPVRDVLAQDGFADAIVQHFGTPKDVLVRLAPRPGVAEKELAGRVVESLGKVGAGEVRLQRVEFVGPQIGEEITEEGGLAMLAALFGILIYVTLRFEWRLALGSVLALFHDTIIVLGFFAVTWMDFDLTAFAAILAVIGYSLNDTIVVYDRVRENFRKVRRGTSVEIMNLALNETLSRTVMTGVTTMLVLMSLYLYGGELLHSFTVALIVGVVFGIYSSVYVASALALALGVSRADLMPVQKEGADTRP
jgi:preprotein translocase subunit SecF